MSAPATTAISTISSRVSNGCSSSNALVNVYSSSVLTYPILLAMVLMEYSVNLFLILIGYRHNGIAPILMPDENRVHFAQYGVDPLPQALVLTSIVINLSITAVALSIIIHAYRRFGTLDSGKLRSLKG